MVYRDHCTYFRNGSCLYVLTLSTKSGFQRQKKKSVQAVTGFSANFQFQDGTYYLSEDTQFYQDGVMFCVYDDNGKLLYAQCQRNFRNRRS